MASRRQANRKRGVLIRDHGRCHYCGCELTLETMTIDHKIPRSAGGKTVVANLAAACEPCNKAKADRPYASFKTVRHVAKLAKPMRPWDLPDDTTREYA